MKKKESLSFAVSFEELLVLLYHFKRNDMAGLDKGPLESMSDKEKNLLMAVAERALIARGFLTRSADSNIKMIDPVLALVGTCLEPEISLIVKNTPVNGLEQLYLFHAARKMRVMHSTPITGIHQFIAVEDDKAFLQALISAMNIGELSRISAEEGFLVFDTLETGRDIALEKGFDAAKKIFVENTLSESLAVELAKALAAPVSNTTVSVVKSLDDSVQGFTLLRGEKSLWIISPTGSDDQVSIKSVSSNGAAQKLKSLVTKIKV
ncbi:MAG: hypothetical protein HN741_05830 [Anaerolineae bacterium]|jgi:hypothetical protein|nr:hypothetical protein [Anaerolineae bacterium]